MLTRGLAYVGAYSFSTSTVIVAYVGLICPNWEYAQTSFGMDFTVCAYHMLAAAGFSHPRHQLGKSTIMASPFARGMGWRNRSIALVGRGGASHSVWGGECFVVCVLLDCCSEWRMHDAHKSVVHLQKKARWMRVEILSGTLPVILRIQPHSKRVAATLCSGVFVSLWSHTRLHHDGYFSMGLRLTEVFSGSCT